jgi:hypothetical protein
MQIRTIPLRLELPQPRDRGCLIPYSRSDHARRRFMVRPYFLTKCATMSLLRPLSVATRSNTEAASATIPALAPSAGSACRARSTPPSDAHTARSADLYQSRSTRSASGSAQSSQRPSVEHTRRPVLCGQVRRRSSYHDRTSSPHRNRRLIRTRSFARNRSNTHRYGPQWDATKQCCKSDCDSELLLAGAVSI